MGGCVTKPPQSKSKGDKNTPQKQKRPDSAKENKKAKKQPEKEQVALEVASPPATSAPPDQAEPNRQSLDFDKFKPGNKEASTDQGKDEIIKKVEVAQQPKAAAISTYQVLPESEVAEINGKEISKNASEVDKDELRKNSIKVNPLERSKTVREKVNFGEEIPIDSSKMDRSDEKISQKLEQNQDDDIQSEEKNFQKMVDLNNQNSK